MWYQSHAEFLRWGQKIMHALQTSGTFHREIQLRRKDGSLFWCRTTAQALDRSDLSKGVVGILEDITLERENAETLRKAKEDAEAASRAKTQFLANMSHEIRTPLNAILGFTHLIRRDPLSPQQINQLDKLADASHHLQKILNDVLELSKIEANKITLDDTIFSPERVIDQVRTIAGHKIQVKNLHIHTDIRHIPEQLRGDGARLRQILLNLLDNAVKFTEQGRIDIRARVVQQSPESIVLRFTVQDTGIGMRDDQIARIFQAFEQADSSTTRRFGGTGLGLAICKQLVELMGGGIGVESQWGEGTTFWVEIPFAPAEETFPRHRVAIEHAEPSPDAEQMQESALAQRRGSRILLVEDNFVNQEVACMLLESMGMEVDVADNGEAALAMVAKKPFDLVFMDIQMPVMDGLEATTAIRRLPDRQTMPILAMTANAFVEDRERCLQAGMNDHISKPIDLQKLRSLLIEWLAPRTATKPSPRPAVSATDATDIPAQLRAIEGLDVDAGLRLLLGNTEGYLRLLVQFSEQHGEDAQRMTASAHTRDWPMLRAQSHALKGAAATLGISTVARLAESLEMTAKTSTALHSIPAMIAAIQSDLHRFMNAVHHITIPAAATPPAPVDHAQIRQILERLASLLAIEDSAANDEFDQARPLLTAAFGPQAELLGHQIESYDYNDAQETVRSLLQY
jgi:signal transduction histidine kinase/CheY-like chemotaxis protein